MKTASTVSAMICISPSTAWPVSYTHLDVYKRQENGVTGAQMQRGQETFAIHAKKVVAAPGRGGAQWLSQSCEGCLLYTSRCV